MQTKVSTEKELGSLSQSQANQDCCTPAAVAQLRRRVNGTLPLVQSATASPPAGPPAPAVPAAAAAQLPTMTAAAAATVPRVRGTTRDAVQAACVRGHLALRRKPARVLCGCSALDDARRGVDGRGVHVNRATGRASVACTSSEASGA